MQEDYLEFIKHLLGIKEGDKVNGPTWKKFRNYDHVHANPHNKQQRVRVQMVWNGHPDHYGLHWGLRTYTDPSHQVCWWPSCSPIERRARAHTHTHTNSAREAATSVHARSTPKSMPADNAPPQHRRRPEAPTHTTTTSNPKRQRPRGPRSPSALSERPTTAGGGGGGGKPHSPPDPHFIVGQK